MMNSLSRGAIGYAISGIGKGSESDRKAALIRPSRSVWRQPHDATVCTRGRDEEVEHRSAWRIERKFLTHGCGREHWRHSPSNDCRSCSGKHVLEADSLDAHGDDSLIQRVARVGDDLVRPNDDDAIPRFPTVTLVLRYERVQRLTNRESIEIET